MRSNRDGKAVVPGRGGYDIEVVEVIGGPDRMMPMPPAKSRGRFVPMGDGENLPEGVPQRPGPGERIRKRVPLVPTRDEIERLPRWARVALAARCARRVLPAFGFFWTNAPEHHRRAVERAVGVAEGAANDRAADTYAAAQAAFDAADAPAAIGAAYVAKAAHFALARAWAADVLDAVEPAAEILFRAATTDTPLTAQLRCIRRDFARLKRLAREQKWTDDTPVPPSVFGPMWPDGVAPYWAAETPT